MLLDLFNNVPPTPDQIRLTALAASAAGDAGDAYLLHGRVPDRRRRAAISRRSSCSWRWPRPTSTRSSASATRRASTRCATTSPASASASSAPTTATRDSRAAAAELKRPGRAARRRSRGARGCYNAGSVCPWIPNVTHCPRLPALALPAVPVRLRHAATRKQARSARSVGAHEPRDLHVQRQVRQGHRPSGGARLPQGHAALRTDRRPQRLRQRRYHDRHGERPAAGAVQAVRQRLQPPAAQHHARHRRPVRPGHRRRASRRTTGTSARRSASGA